MANGGFSKAITALATLEEKLRRALGLAGAIGSSFEPILRPVIVTGDLREPGNSFFRGRHFAVALGANFGAGTNFHSLRFDADCIVEGIGVGCQTAATTNAIFYTAPNEAPAVAVPTQCGTWIDRKTATVDLAPFMRGGPGALTGTNATAANTIIQVTGGQSVFPMRLFMPAGSALNATFAPAQIATFTVWGRIAEAT